MSPYLFLPAVTFSLRAPPYHLYKLIHSHHHHHLVTLAAWSSLSVCLPVRLCLCLSLLSSIAPGRSSRLHSVPVKICLNLSASPGSSTYRGPYENVAYEFVLTSPAVPFLCSSHLAFSLGASLISMSYIHIAVLTQPQLGRNSVINQISIWSINCQQHSTPSLSVGGWWHYFKLMRCCCRGMWTSVGTLEACPLEWKMVPSCLKQMNSVLYAFT